MPTLVHSYAPRGGCLEAFRDRGPEVLVSGPAGTGKSRACLEKMNLIMLRTPGARGLIVRKTAESLTTTALVTWKEHVIKEALASGLVDFYGGSKDEPAQYRYYNGTKGAVGSKVMVGGMNKPTRIMSTEYDVVYVQEAIELTETDWESLSSRLRNGKLSFQQLLADTNPDVETHWLHARANDPELPLRMIESRHADNPTLYRADGQLTTRGAAYMERLDALTGVRKERLRYGRWVSSEGAVYEEWDPAVHLVDRFEIPEHWPRFWGVDFGFTHPMVITMWARDDDGGLWLYRQHYGTGRTVEDWAELVLDSVRVHREVDHHGREWPAADPTTDGERPPGAPFEWMAPARTSCGDPNHWKDPYALHHYEWTEPMPDAVVCDHDADGRETLQRLIGLPCEKADKRVDIGIDLVKQRLKDRRLHVLRGSLVAADPARRQAHRPTCLEEEISGYRRDPRTSKVIKVDDDGCDTARYVVVWVATQEGANVRWLD